MKTTRPNSTDGFTRSELLVVVAMLGVLCLVQLPARANGAAKSRVLACLSNLKRLSLGWVLFANDHSDRLPGVLHGGPAMSPVRGDTRAPWCVGWLDWTTSPQNTNALYVTNPGYSSIAKYVNLTPEDLRCPEDHFVSAVQKSRGWDHRIRSYVGSVAVGDGNAEEGPWDATYYRHLKKTSDFVIPSPSATFVYTEEHPDSINDPALQLPYASSWVDLPGSFHNGAANFTFGDGHAEMHKWLDGNTSRTVRYLTYSMTNPTNRVDLDWVRHHAPRQRE